MMFSYLVHLLVCFHSFTLLATIEPKQRYRKRIQYYAFTLLLASIWPLVTHNGASIGISIWLVSLTPVALLVVLLKSYAPRLLIQLLPPWLRPRSNGSGE